MTQEELSLKDLHSIYKRRRKLIYRITLGFFLLAAIYCLLATRRYQAISTIQVQTKNSDSLGLQSMLTGTAQTELDALSANINLQTQAGILQSDTLALATINKLHLEGTEDFKPRWNPVAWVLGLLSPSGIADPTHADLEHSPQRRRRVLLVFQRFLSVKPLNGTSLIEISYLNPDPRVAADVVNELSQELAAYSTSTKADAMKKASTWVSGQLSGLREQSDRLEKQVATQENDSNIYILGTTDTTGREQTYSGVLEQLQQASTALSQAQQNRIVRGAISHAADNGDADMLADLAGSATGGGTVNNSLALIQSLRAQQATQEANLSQLEVKFDDTYPRIAELRGSIAGIQQSIQQEITRLKGRAKADYEVATLTEADERKQFEKIKDQANKLNNKSVGLAVRRQEADESRKLYLDLLAKFNEADTLQGLDGSSISIVDPGRPAGKPKRPLVPLVMGLGLLGGFAVGCFSALLIDVLDTRLVTIGQLERSSGKAPLAVTPYFDQRASESQFEGVPRLIALSSPQSGFAEAVRAIRTAIFLRSREHPAKVILVTSSLRGEGKSTLSANLAVLLAQAGRKTLLMDANLRQTSLASFFDVSIQKGLSHLLTGDSIDPVLQLVASVPNLHLLQAGSNIANASEALSGDGFARWLAIWKESYSHIVIDSAALLPVTDSLALAQLSDITLLVARSDFTDRAELSRGLQLIEGSGKPNVAVIFNGLRPDSDGYASYFGSRDLKGKKA